MIIGFAFLVVPPIEKLVDHSIITEFFVINVDALTKVRYIFNALDACIKKKSNERDNDFCKEMTVLLFLHFGCTVGWIIVKMIFQKAREDSNCTQLILSSLAHVRNF